MTKSHLNKLYIAVLTVFISLFICQYTQAAVKLESAVLDENVLYINGTVDRLGADPQLTLIITPLREGAYDLNNIIYIGQQSISNSLFTLQFPLTLDDGYYVARIGGSDIDDPRFILINRKGKEYHFIFGDVDESGIIDAFDASLTLQYVLTPDLLSLSALQLYAANVENDSQLSASSASWILAKTLNEQVKFPVEY